MPSLVGSEMCIRDSVMMQCLLWRVMTKRHRKITLSFLVAGHTKFSPDWCFGLFKRTFRRTKVDCLDGSPLVAVRNWSGFLDTWFRKLVGLKTFHHPCTLR
eukprot:TRINITY_DN68672_c0_g2_i5.p1 TRINITY_DN68672_c0_g2~~TRINITY_DN68672_c0_g2_i5.p1  ORF type:complete len:101 (+),score=14.05 TRINITY_DN68672_c0_g2_i5:1-303(+)